MNERTPSSRVRNEASGPVRVWSEATVTICVTDDPPQFVKFTTGHERHAPNDKPETIARVEAQIFEQCEEIVNKRVKRLQRIVNAVHEPVAAKSGQRRRS